MDAAQLIELNANFSNAAKSLRCAWRLMKHGGMDATAKEIADTVLDVEEAARKVRGLLDEARER